MSNQSTQPSDVAEMDELTERIRTELGRQLVVVMLPAPEGTGDELDRFSQRLRELPEVRVAEVAPLDARAARRDIERALAEVATQDPDALLVWTGGPDAPGEQWRINVLGEAERQGICDQCLVALAGADVTRARARKLGYEDGYSPDTPVLELARALLREALARDEFRRRGSSPPCYL